MENQQNQCHNYFHKQYSYLKYVNIYENIKFVNFNFTKIVS